MPIAIFSNNNNTYSLFLTIQPSEERHEIPQLASAGVRYVLEEGAEDRSFSELRGDRIEYWCNAESYEVEIVHPSPFDRLLWDMCVANGFCGGVTDGQPMHVTDLIPADGVISAEEFAELVLRAECDGPNPEPQRRRWAQRIAALFIKHFGAPVMPVEALRINPRRPFDPHGDED